MASEKFRPRLDIRKPEAIKVMEGIEDRDLESTESRFDTFKFVLEDIGIHLTPNSKILEVGTGSGDFISHLRQNGLDAFGVDFRPRGETDGVVAARIEQLPFKDNEFDIVTSTAIFDKGFYIQNQTQMIKDIARVLKQGGVYLARGEEFRKPRGLLDRVKKFDGEVPIVVYQKFSH